MKQVGYTTGFWNALEVVNTGHSFNKYENIHHVKNYAYSGEPKTKECIENPDVVYAKTGMGGEIRYVFDKDIVYTFLEYISMI